MSQQSTASSSRTGDLGRYEKKLAIIFIGSTRLDIPDVFHNEPFELKYVDRTATFRDIKVLMVGYSMRYILATQQSALLETLDPSLHGELLLHVDTEKPSQLGHGASDIFISSDDTPSHIIDEYIKGLDHQMKATELSRTMYALTNRVLEERAPTNASLLAMNIASVMTSGRIETFAVEVGGKQKERRHTVLNSVVNYIQHEFGLKPAGDFVDLLVFVVSANGDGYSSDISSRIQLDVRVDEEGSITTDAEIRSRVKQEIDRYTTKQGVADHVYADAAIMTNRATSLLCEIDSGTKDEEEEKYNTNDEDGRLSDANREANTSAANGLHDEADEVQSIFSQSSRPSSNPSQQSQSRPSRQTHGHPMIQDLLDDE